MTTLNCDLLTTDAAIEELRPEWEALWRRVPDATPFQSPRWLLPWWHAFGTHRPFVATLRDAQDRLAALLPLYLLNEGTERKLLPIGAGITDYCDALLAPGLPADAADALVHTALRAARGENIAAYDLIEVPPASVLRSFAAPPGWRAEWRDGDVCPVLILPGASNGLRGYVPARTLRKLRMARHRADRIGGWTTQIAGAEDVQPFLGELIALHAARWTARGQPGGVLADPLVQEFHREAVPQLLAVGMLRLQVLRFGQRVVACCLALLAGRNRMFFYLSGFDPAHEFESPGTILLGEMIEAAQREGRRELHFLRGGEAYKYAWGARDRRNAACRLVPA